MKTAKIKRGRRKRGLFLLENVDSRIAITHEKISSYRQRGIQTKMTKTILNEFDENKVRKIVDEKCYFLNFAQRMHIIKQILKKKKEIISRFGSCFNIGPDDIKEMLESITAFYMSPDIKQKLEEVKERKRSRYLLPSPNDMTILAECCFIKNLKRERTILLTDDAHFTAFSYEIKKRFDIGIDPIT